MTFREGVIKKPPSKIYLGLALLKPPQKA